MGLGFGVWGLWFEVWGLGFGVRASGLAFLFGGGGSSVEGLEGWC